MSITKFRNSSARFIKYGLFAFLLIFVASIFFMNGRAVNSGSGNEGRNESIIAIVNGKKINGAELNMRVRMQADMYKRVGGMSALQEAQLRSETLNGLINEQIVLTAAEKKGISAGRREIGQERNRLIEARIDQDKQMAGEKGEKMTDKEFDNLLKRTSNKQGLSGLRKQYKAELTNDKVRAILIMNKLEAQMKASAGKVDDKKLEDNFRQLKVRQIVFYSNNAPEQAERKAEEVHKKLLAGEDFAKMASRHSDDQSSKSKGGDMGFIPAAQDKDLQSLKVGQVSGVIKLPYGYRIVKVEDSKLELPKDFDKKKKEYRDQLAQQLQMEAMNEFFEKAKESAKIEVVNSEMKGYWLTRQAMSEPDAAKRNKKFQEALASLDKSIKAREDAAPYVEKAVIHQYMGENKKAIDTLVEILDKKRITEHYELRLMLAQLCIQAGENDKAVPQLQLASEMSYDGRVHMMLKSMYEQLGRKDLAADETKWMEENPEAMAKLNPPEVETSPVDKTEKGSAKPK